MEHLSAIATQPFSYVLLEHDLDLGKSADAVVHPDAEHLNLPSCAQTRLGRIGNVNAADLDTIELVDSGAVESARLALRPSRRKPPHDRCTRGLAGCSCINARKGARDETTSTRRSLRLLCDVEPPLASQHIPERHRPPLTHAAPPPLIPPPAARAPRSAAALAGPRHPRSARHVPPTG